MPSTEPHQLPDAIRCLRRHVPLRRQRPGGAGTPEPELQPALPHHRDGVRGDAGRQISRPTSRRPRSACSSSQPGTGRTRGDLSGRRHHAPAVRGLQARTSTDSGDLHHRRASGFGDQARRGHPRRDSSAHDRVERHRASTCTVPAGTPTGAAPAARSPRTTASAPPTA